MNAEAASQVVRISRATLYRWKKRFREKGWAGIEPVSRRPKQLRKKRWREEIIEEVQSLRRLYPRWGKEKIRDLMAADGIEVSVSTVGRIIRYLKERKAIPEAPYRKRWKGKRQSKRPYAIRKPKGYAVVAPGDIIQVDTLDLHPFPGVHFKHFTARDVVSRWDVVEVYPKSSSRQAKAFLETLLQRLPCKPKAVQVDGGSEFMAEFEDACARHHIALFVLPPRSPKLNGRVERAHRTHLDEFYAIHEPEGDLESLNNALRCWEWVYNHVRPHRALDNLSPMQYIQKITSLDPLLSHMY